MVGKGSVNHNSREFNAKNTDPQRTHLNTEYCNIDIKEVYHYLFDDALETYNEKQKRADRRIENYYEKIRTGRQEKLFHEVIIQIGNYDDTNAKTPEGELAERILDEYYREFQKRNPYLYVFSAHLHMDEATPHLHIDFVPFTTESKRGLDTRVSLKQALANQGFIGKSRQETEWSLWVESEKKALEEVMNRHSVQWEQKGTHEKHLSVYDYEKKMRKQEVEELTQQTENMEKQVKSKERVADRGEVFTAEREVKAMCDLVKDETERIDSRFLEPACGDGNFLAEILRRKLAVVKNKYRKSTYDYEMYSVLAVTSIYGVDIMLDNVQDCRERLFKIWDSSVLLKMYKDVYTCVFGELFPDKMVYAKKYESLTVCKQFQPTLFYDNEMLKLLPDCKEQNDKMLAARQRNQEVLGIDTIVTDDRIPKTGLYTIDKQQMEKWGVEYTAEGIIDELFFSRFVGLGVKQIIENGKDDTEQ